MYPPKIEAHKDSMTVGGDGVTKEESYFATNNGRRSGVEVGRGELKALSSDKEVGRVEGVWCV